MNPPGRWRWLCHAVGTTVAGWGVLGLLTGPHTNPVAWARFALTVVLANDGLLAPLIVLAGVGLTRTLPTGSRPLVQIGLLISGSVTLVALPAVLGHGRSPDNPSALPLDYGRGLLVLLVGVWAALGLIALVRRAAAKFTAPPSR